MTKAEAHLCALVRAGKISVGVVKDYDELSREAEAAGLVCIYDSQAPHEQDDHDLRRDR